MFTSFRLSLFQIDLANSIICSKSCLSYVNKKLLLYHVYLNEFILNKGFFFNAFPSQINCSKNNIKSIGDYGLGDTLKIELIEKRKRSENTFGLPCLDLRNFKKNN